MNNEALYRGKSLDNGKWVEGDDIDNIIDSSTKGRYTGCTDKNGVKVFEGDIVFRIVGENKYWDVVQWIEALKEWNLGFRGLLSTYNAEQIEVVGNIHDYKVS